MDYGTYRAAQDRELWVSNCEQQRPDNRQPGKYYAHENHLKCAKKS